MTEQDYFLIYALVEFCAATLIAAVVLGFKWWRLYRRQVELTRTCKMIAQRISKEIAELGGGRAEGAAHGDARVAFLESLAKPFETRDIADALAWNLVLDDLHHVFYEWGRKQEEAIPPTDDAGYRVSGEKGTPVAAPDLREYLGLNRLDSGIDDLLAQYETSQSSFSANRGDIGTLTEKCRQLDSANRELRLQLKSAKKSDLGAPLNQYLDSIERQNADLMNLLAESDQHQNTLGLELERLATRILSLKSTNQEYRKLVQEILLERDSLAEQKRQLLVQIQRMNRSYSSLRLEYSKLYRSTR
ncbi:hypothetical protein [Thiorhodococcus fuscus]|uniref:Uncharacterized protein n=1 Tax=Thiorhodococcus fuscus TaxID=527200 RepID=A0ABW4Y5H9_9GAMM